jgi:hypothetical protein
MLKAAPNGACERRNGAECSGSRCANIRRQEPQ